MSIRIHNICEYSKQLLKCFSLIQFQAFRNLYKTVHVQAFSSKYTTNLHHGHIQAIRQESFRRRYKSASLPGSPWIRPQQVDIAPRHRYILYMLNFEKKQVQQINNKNTYTYSFGMKSYVNRINYSNQINVYRRASHKHIRKLINTSREVNLKHVNLRPSMAKKPACLYLIAWTKHTHMP